MRVILVAITSLLVSFTSFNTIAQEEDDFLLLALPAIIAGSQKTCEPSVANSCNYKGICEKFEGYWYWDACHLDPKGLVLTRRLVGTWDFYYRYGTNNANTSHYVSQFIANTIKPVGSAGNYQIGGQDITRSYIKRSATATYNADTDIVYIVFPRTSYPSRIPGSDATIQVFADYWYMDFVTAGELVGLHTTILSSTFPPDDPAWATKR